MIRVAVHGALGRMGQQVLAAVCQDPDTELVGAADMKADAANLTLADGSAEVPLTKEVAPMLKSCRPDVMVDFTIARAVMPAARAAASQRVNLVIGTTGLKPDNVKEIDKLSQASDIGVIIAPNFALGAVMMMHLAQVAAKHFDYAEIIEMHHHMKVDAPSGTALSTAKAMAKSKGGAFTTPSQKENLTSRGEKVDGISIHSVRLPGLMAHQEVILGAAGQTLRIRHDTINRECYMPGVLLAIKEAAQHKGLTYGLDVLLGLKGG